MSRSRRRPAVSSPVRRRVLTALALTATVATVASCGTPAPDRRPATRVFPAAIEATPQYQPATMPCDPADSFAKPGPVAFEKLLLDTYGPTWAGTVRACDGSQSEHNEGRALDWGMDYTNTTQRQHGQTVIDWLRETDTAGRTNAVARRLGIQYFIWNHQMYGSWNNFNPTPYACNGTPTDCHVNHIHFSFTWSGALKMTSFWAGVPLPAASVGTTQTVDARSAVPTVAPRALPGYSYTIEASGTYKFGTATTQVADANCSIRNGVWSATSGRASLFGAKDLKLAVEDASNWAPTTNTGGGCNTKDHRYQLTPLSWQHQDFYGVVQDPVRSDNSGTLTMKVVAAR